MNTPFKASLDLFTKYTKIIKNIPVDSLVKVLESNGVTAGLEMPRRWCHMEWDCGGYMVNVEQLETGTGDFLWITRVKKR